MTALCSPKYKFPIWLVFKYVVQSLGEIVVTFVTWYDNATGVDWQHNCTPKLKAFFVPPVFVLAANSCSQSINRSIVLPNGRLEPALIWSSPGPRSAACAIFSVLSEETREPGTWHFIIQCVVVFRQQISQYCHQNYLSLPRSNTICYDITCCSSCGATFNPAVSLQ